MYTRHLCQASATDIDLCTECFDDTFTNRTIDGLANLGHELSHIVDMRANGGSSDRFFIKWFTDFSEAEPGNKYHSVETEDRAFRVDANIRLFLRAPGNADIYQRIRGGHVLSRVQLERIQTQLAPTIYSQPVYIQLRYAIVNGQLVLQGAALVNVK